MNYFSKGWTRELHWCCTSEEDALKKWLKEGLVELRNGQYYIYLRRRGAKLLSVAHLDMARGANLDRSKFAIADGKIFNHNLDDRLGLWYILYVLPRMGVVTDVLLTTDEEIGMSTAEDWTAPPDAAYNWIVQFDRRGIAPVLYEYDSPEWRAAIERHTGKVAEGSFSDICMLQKVGVKAVNWGTGYYEEHTVKHFAKMADIITVLDSFYSFWSEYKDVKFPHVEVPTWKASRYLWDEYIGGAWSIKTAPKGCKLCGVVEPLYAVNKNDKSYPLCRRCFDKRYPSRKAYPLDEGSPTCEKCGKNKNVSPVFADNSFELLCADCSAANHVCDWCGSEDDVVRVEISPNKGLYSHLCIDCRGSFAPHCDRCGKQKDLYEIGDKAYCMECIAESEDTIH